MREEKPADAIEKFLLEEKAIEDRKQALIEDLLQQRADAIKAFDDKLAKLGYKSPGNRPRKRSHTARPERGVTSDGFHTTESPHTNASAAFHDHTATGKLNAEMTATGPAGCHCSIMRWPGRSDAIVRP